MTAFGPGAALLMSHLIATKFDSTSFTGRVTRKVKVQAPPAESMGKRCIESIVLRSVSGDVKETITCGFLDLDKRSCDLRSYATLKTLHQQHNQTPLDLDRREYDAFLAEVKTLLDQKDFVIELVGPAARQAHIVAPKPEQTGGTTGFMIAIGAVAAVVVAGAVTVLFAMA